MRRKHDAHKDELEGVAARLRSERPEASPLELDQIKTSAMSRAKSGTRRNRAGARRLATAGLTIGLLAAGTGGVIAGGDPSGHTSNASYTQYGSNCVAGNGNSGNGGEGNGNGGSGSGNGSGNGGSFNGNGSGNFNCNENSFNTETNTTNTTVNNYTTNDTAPVTVDVVPAGTSGSSGVLAAKTTKPALSLRDIKIHLKLSGKSRLKKVTLKLDGKTFKVLKGKAASTNINLTHLPCGSGATTITVVAVTSSGKTVTESHTYNLCQA
jgi:hypothetical protein